jgi:hypothetical protein
VNFWIVAETNLGEIFENISKNGKQIAKVLETIKLSRKLTPII